MTGWDLFERAWNPEPSVLAGCFVALAGYGFAVRGRIDRAALRFLAAVAVVLVALVSPLDALADDYLFSAHMAQHLLLDLVAPALFVLGVSPALARRMLRHRALAAIERRLRRPVMAWLLGVGTLTIWHLPSLYDATLASETVHVLEHLSFLVTGTIFWWPALAPLAQLRLPPPVGLAYLVSAAMANGLLGILFTLSSTPWYQGYAHPRDELGALALIREQWGLSRLIDQQLGGALMWVLGSLVFLAAIVAALAGWVREREEVSRS